jgi:hypothetical protein
MRTVGRHLRRPSGPLHLADAHLQRALTELVKVVLAVDTAEPCLNNDHDHDDQPVTAAVEAGR